MTIYTGRKISVGLGKETTRGTKVDPTMYYAHLDFSAQDKVEYKENESSIGVLAKTFEKDVVKKSSEISIKGILGSETAGFFFLAILGNVVSADNNSAFEHNFSLLNNNSHPTFTIVEKNGIEGLAYALGGINKLGLNFEQGNYVELDTSWEGKISEPTTLNPTYSEETKFKARQVEIFEAEDIAGLDSATAICVESGGLEITKESEQVYCLGDIAPVDVITKALDIQGNLTIKHTSNKFSNYQKEGTERAIRIKIVDTSVTIGTDQHPTIIVDLPKVSFDEVSKEGGKDDIIKQNLNFSGLFDLTTSNLVSVKMINTTNTY